MSPRLCLRGLRRISGALPCLPDARREQRERFCSLRMLQREKGQCTERVSSVDRVMALKAKPKIGGALSLLLILEHVMENSCYGVMMCFPSESWCSA